MTAGGMMGSRPCAVGLILLTGLFAVANSQVCRLQFPKLGVNYTACNAISTPAVQSPTALTGPSFSWSWYNDSRIIDGTYVGQPEQNGGWVAWGINYDRDYMFPADVLACYVDPSTGVPVVNQYQLTSTDYSGVNLGGNMTVLNTSCRVDSSSNPQTFYLTFSLNLGSRAKFYMIYGGGPGVKGTTLQQHSTNPSTTSGTTDRFDARNGTVNGTGGGVQGTVIGGVSSGHDDFKNTHGALNAVGWGIILPLGAIVARYGKFADPLWFYVHMVLQLSGYIIGTIGFGYGLKLRDWYPGHDTHYILGIIIFVIATLQILSVALKPGKGTALRIYWYGYHWTGGVAVIVLAIVNNFIGFHLLQNYGHWRLVYIVLIGILGGVAFFLETLTWGIWILSDPPNEDGGDDVVKPKAVDGNTAEAQHLEAVEENGHAGESVGGNRHAGEEYSG